MENNELIDAMETTTTHSDAKIKFGSEMTPDGKQNILIFTQRNESM
jgi:hypothetical protein